MSSKHSVKIRRRWTRAILFTIIILGGFFGAMIWLQPAHSTMWTILFVVYIPIVLILATSLKWIAKITRKTR
mgnify:FL=1|tara:strand:+ start:22465 stop:22680 length:216 start_codon:yes stop_codon:yes gene_type:complete